jgi:serine/threonine protein kinase
MIIHGVDYCHSQFVCHRDLKPENILLDSEKRLKIADLGMASIVRTGKLLATSCGSPHYASPEVVMGKEYDGRLADVWSCGVILYALVSGKLPFDDENIRVLLRKVKEGQFVMPPFLHRDIRDLISRMLVVDPTKRITISQIKQHQWFTSNHNPVLTAPCTTLEDSCEPIPATLVDAEVVATLESLGLGTASEVSEQLIGTAPSQARMFYRILVYQKDHPPSEVYERIVRSQGRARAMSTSVDIDSTTIGSLSLTMPERTVVLPHPATHRPPSGGRERSCSVGGPKMPAVNLPRVTPTGTEAQPSAHARPTTPSSPSPLRQGTTDAAAAACTLPLVLAGTPHTSPPPIEPLEESPSGSHSRRKKSLSGSSKHLVISPKGSGPVSPLTSPPAARRRAPSDADEFPTGGTSPARRTFWASIFKRPDKPSSAAAKPHASDLGVHSS